MNEGENMNIKDHKTIRVVAPTQFGKHWIRQVMEVQEPSGVTTFWLIDSSGEAIPASKQLHGLFL